VTYQSQDPRAHHVAEEEPVVLPAREARQGTWGTPVRNVLIGGLLLVIIAFAVIYFVMAG
jgi:hypothetical protein